MSKKKQPLSSDERAKLKHEKEQKKLEKQRKKCSGFEIVRYKNSGYVPPSKLGVIGMIVNSVRYLIDKNYKQSLEQRRLERLRAKQHDRTVTLINFLTTSLNSNPYEFKEITLQIDNQFSDVIDYVINNLPEFSDYYFEIIDMNMNYKRFISKPHILLKATFKGYINSTTVKEDKNNEFDIEAYVSRSLHS